ncbi:hypothetical protein JZO86_03930 [Enterococcus ureasiticus]|uniref:hypothetical protein n=1 Tax=Enterococcus ureasiticus TaxID=903984 RepID=UPI001A8C5762|nr:hypothetical protein [Enterococcus ureasiticus]MBO0472853.1 hypothetical protein [Enterococcus ureasiticus]
MENDSLVNITINNFINIYHGEVDKSIKLGDKNKIDHSSIGESKIENEKKK